MPDLKWFEVRSIVFNSNGDIYAGTTEGVFRYTTSSGSWHAINTGLTGTNIVDLVINTDGDLFAGTWCSGVFRLKEKSES